MSLTFLILSSVLAVVSLFSASMARAAPIRCEDFFNPTSLPKASYSHDPSQTPVPNFRSGWQSLPVGSDQPFPKSFVERIRQHPIAQKLISENQGQKNLFFSLDYFFDRGHVSGWTIQGVFLRKMLQTIFPNAEFKDSFGYYERKKLNADPRTRIFELSMDDATLGPVNSHLPQYFDMGLLKSLHPNPENIDAKTSHRERAALPQEFRVMAIYWASSKDEPAVEKIRLLLTDGNFDVFILSTQNNDHLSLIQTAFKDLSVRVLSSEEWMQERPAKGVRYLIINNTRGRMNALYTTADTAVIIGAGNFQEPIQQGIPTYFESIPELVARRQSGFAWQETAEFARRSGLGFSFSNSSELQNLLRNPPTPIPVSQIYETPGPNGLTPLDIFMNRVDGLLRDGETKPEIEN